MWDDFTALSARGGFTSCAVDVNWTDMVCVNILWHDFA